MSQPQKVAWLPNRRPQAMTLHDRAADNLRFIRETMERATSFTAVSGQGSMATGILALGATLISQSVLALETWISLWSLTALVALLVNGWFIYHKAQQSNEPLWSSATRKFTLSFAPPMIAGAILSLLFYHLGLGGYLPGLWLLLYGAGIVSAGTFSVEIVPLMGLCFMAMGGAALLTPFTWGSLWMAMGFGGLHLLFGAWIARRYGG